MSFTSLGDLKIQPDGYTYAVILLLEADFLLVQTHFWTMQKLDPMTKESNAIKLLSWVSILAEFLVLTPLFFFDKLAASSVVLLVLVFLGLAIVELNCFGISLLKTWAIHARMLAEKQITSHLNHLVVATALIFISYVCSSFLGSYASLIGFVGLCIYLYVLNVMRRNYAPQVTTRIFYSQIISMMLGFCTFILLVIMSTAVAAQVASNIQQTATSGFNNPSAVASSMQSTMSNLWDVVRGYFIGFLVLNIMKRFMTLLTTGHYVGDACCGKPEYLNFEDQSVDYRPHALAVANTDGNKP